VGHSTGSRGWWATHECSPTQPLLRRWPTVWLHRAVGRPPGRPPGRRARHVERANEEFARRRGLIASAFSPASPLTNKELFAGRIPQIARLLEVVDATGRHAIIYGERGVGKTSLARVAELYHSLHKLALYYTCSSVEDFSSIWRGVLGDARLTVHQPAVGFGSRERETLLSATELLGTGTVSPNMARQALTVLSESGPVVVFIDEFDRLVDAKTKALFADMIKLLSDHATPVTLILVGVGDTVDDLVMEHASIQRNLVQIPMPRMDDSEIEQIITKGMEAAELEVEAEFTSKIVSIAQGLPHYAHLLSQHAAYAAAADSRTRVAVGDLSQAIARALNDVSETIRDKYYQATGSNRETIYREVLLACALASKDEIGTFGPSDVRECLREITGQSYSLQAFATHLKDFSSVGVRGGVLKKREGHRPRYRFIDPLLPPYVVMRSTADGLLSPSGDRALLQGKQPGLL
jgi:Cdc6-like AAA superfamily ATPase